jgi:hypothetical protein
MALPILLLHGLAGGWDELIVLAAGILLAIFVVKWTSRSSHDDDEQDDEIVSASDGVSEKPTEQP